jgi:hypothetical protein
MGSEEQRVHSDVPRLTSMRSGTTVPLHRSDFEETIRSKPIFKIALKQRTKRFHVSSSSVMVENTNSDMLLSS